MIKKSKWIIPFFIMLVLVGGCFNKQEKPKENKTPTPKDETPIVEEPKTYSFSLAAVGDALIHNGIYDSAYVGNNNYDFTKMFTYIKPIINKFDLAFYNQETVIGGKNIGVSTYPNFNSPDEIGLNLLDTGFNLVNLATNHTLDRGANATLYSVDFWKTKDALAVGSYASFEERNEPVIKEINNITYSMLGYTYGTNGIAIPNGKEYLVNVYDAAKVKEDIERVRDKVDVLMVSMHWGVEYTHVPTKTQRQQAEYLASLGVDIIIGHHPHVIQPIEFIDDTVVIYSLGNFISGQNTEAQRVGLMAALTVNKTVDGEDITIEITDVKGDLFYTGWQPVAVIPFNKLTDNRLYGYQSIYEKYSKIINNTNDERIQVGFFE
ncbi:MAG: CapA family protein [Bacilli bacterium]|nr:CapA family protein [Bacilli bacterium]MDD4809190.1 CapA family protein [Bacilli bacterium]